MLRIPATVDNLGRRRPSGLPATPATACFALTMVGDIASRHRQSIELCKLWVFAEYIDDMGARKAAVEALLDWAKEKESDYPPEEAVNLIYKGTAQGRTCPAKRLMADLYAFRGTDDLIRHNDTLDPEFVMDLVSFLYRARGKEPRTDLIMIRGASFYEETKNELVEES